MDILFAYGVVAVLAAAYALGAKHLMRGVLGLAMFFIAVAAMFASMGAWYLAVGQLILFVGGVVTLFVLAFNAAKTPLATSGSIMAAVIAFAAAATIAMFLPSTYKYAGTVSLHVLAIELFTKYGWVLNVGLLLLFSAMITMQYLLEDAS
jgi:NADH:ubiquinone oxidoreductase subunit 6 (subunit J)